MKYAHYAPRARLVVVEGPVEGVQAKIKKLALYYQSQGLGVGILATRETAAAYENGEIQVVGGRGELTTVAASLYTCFRRFDALGVDIISAEGFEAVGLGLAIMNRLARRRDTDNSGRLKKRFGRGGVGVWRAFFTTFGLVFLAELGDKTQLTTMLMAAQSRAIWPVFFGSVLALACSSFICVTAGSVIMRCCPPAYTNGGRNCLSYNWRLVIVGEGLISKALKHWAGEDKNGR